MKCLWPSCFGSPVIPFMNLTSFQFFWPPVYGVSIKGSPVVFYIDNDVARSAYIQGVGATATTRLFTDLFVRLECQLRILAWSGRVPSHSNLADEPSRLRFTNPLLKACKRIHIKFPAHFNQVGMASGVLENPCQQHLASSEQT